MKIGTEKELLAHTRQCWRGMRSRCKVSSAYVNKGIIVCEKWQNSYENFLTDMKVCPFLDFTLDRIDNSKGYFPGNCRWRSRFVQNWNKNYPDSRGVTFRKDTQKWMAQVMLNYKTFGLGCFDTKEEALERYHSYSRLIDWMIEVEIIL